MTVIHNVWKLHTVTHSISFFANRGSNLTHLKSDLGPEYLTSRGDTTLRMGGGGENRVYL